MARAKKLKTIAQKGDIDELLKGVTIRLASEIDETTDDEYFTELVKALISVVKISQSLVKSDTPDKKEQTTVLEFVRKKNRQSV